MRSKRSADDAAEVSTSPSSVSHSSGKQASESEASASVNAFATAVESAKGELDELMDAVFRFRADVDAAHSRGEYLKRVLDREEHSMLLLTAGEGARGEGAEPAGSPSKSHSVSLLLSPGSQAHRWDAPSGLAFSAVHSSGPSPARDLTGMLDAAASRRAATVRRRDEDDEDGASEGGTAQGGGDGMDLNQSVASFLSDGAIRE